MSEHEWKAHGAFTVAVGDAICTSYGGKPPRLLPSHTAPKVLASGTHAAGTAVCRRAVDSNEFIRQCRYWVKKAVNLLAIPGGTLLRRFKRHMRRKCRVVCLQTCSRYGALCSVINCFQAGQTLTVMLSNDSTLC